MRPWQLLAMVLPVQPWAAIDWQRQRRTTDYGYRNTLKVVTGPSNLTQSSHHEPESEWLHTLCRVCLQAAYGAQSAARVYTTVF